MAEEFTAKFKVDISDLKKNISEANKAIKTANATFKAETAGMDKWGKDADGLGAKLKQLKTVLQSQKSILASYKSQLQAQQKAYEENGKRAEQLKAKLQQLAKDGVSKTDAEYQKYEKALKTVLKEQDNNNKSIEGLNLSILKEEAAVKSTEKEIKHYSDSLKQVEAEQKKAADEANRQKTAYEQLETAIDKQQKDLDKLKRAYAEVVVEQGKDSKAAQDLKKDIYNLSGELANNKQKLNEADRAADELDQSFDDTKQSAQDATNSGISAMNVALGDLVSQGIQWAIQGLKDLAQAAKDAWEAYDEGKDIITALTGASGENAKELTGVYNNLGKTIKADFTEIGNAVGEVNTRFDLTGDELETVAGQFLKFSQINNTDVKSSIDNVQQSMAAFGVSSDDTTLFLDSLTAASQSSGVSVDTLTSALKSNAPALNEMGYSAQESIDLISSLSKNGVEVSDVMAGMKKAFANAAKSGRPLRTELNLVEIGVKNNASEVAATQKAMELFGNKAGPALAKAMREGRLSFSDFSGEMQDFNGTVNTTFDEIQDAGDKVGLAMQNIRLKAAELMQGLLDKHGPEIEEFLEKVITELLPKLFDALDWLITNLPTIIKTADKLNKFLSPMQMIIFLFNEIKESIKDGAKQISQLWKVASDTWNNVKQVFSKVPDFFKQKFGEAWENIRSKFSQWGAFWSDLWQKVKDKFTGLGTQIGEGISGAVRAGVNKIISGVESRINSAIRIINGAINLINKIPGVSVGRVSEVSFPRLEKGGILKRGQVGLLEGSGSEAVVPLDKNKAWIRSVANEMNRQIKGVSSNSNSTNKTTNYTQVINAPESPSRIEIYRQTKNLLALV